MSDNLVKRNSKAQIQGKSKDGVEKATVTYDFPCYMRGPPEKKPFSKMIWDANTKEIFGRNSKSWGQLLLFYFIFYVVLAALFAICMKGLMYTINNDQPKWKLTESLIGVNPGLGFRPISDNVEESSLIWFNSKDKPRIDYWVTLIDEFLAPYSGNTHLPNGGKNQKVCDFDLIPGYGEVCALDVSEENFGPCSKTHGYGYNKSSPCIFLKLNRIYDWVPEYYDDPKSLPEDMPLDLKTHIASLSPKARKQIWVSCKGETPFDNEAIGPIQYPQRGFPSYFYPFRNTVDYLSPLVAIRFERPKVNQIINVECRAWAKNLIYIGGHRDRQGSVHFELMIDT